ncbi:hypothetical protein OK015_02490 [Mycobacterium sp. Aquia_216]|uniref:hypothetical protein n=1 Tax=Mycobacterium sp. Aquia_216 TaxID=2991729 RepID=UPI00227B49EC|nr:hypothetical protein [Mycobacterium sp. Aquia_216]WAJ45415.1 hypothetical protein OK015_02490 [Mycobacterium sp. Aquia_216]
MTTASNPRGDESGQLPHRLHMRYQVVGERRARRMCRSFADVGVDTGPVRLQQMLAGMPVSEEEVTDVNFALIATQLKRDERNAKRKQLQRQGTRSLMFAGMILLVLNFLFCLAYVMLNLTDQAPL